MLVEVDYLIHRSLNPGMLVALLDDRYADADIGYVDGAVLAITERLGEPKLATLGHRHFGMLRPRHVDALRLVPD